MGHVATIEVLSGPAGSGKTAAALAQYLKIAGAQALANRHRVLWLAPTHAAAEAIRDRLIRQAAHGLLDPGVNTFSRFAASVVWDAGLRVHLFSTLQRRRLIRQVIADARAEGRLQYFGHVATTGGFVNLVDESIARLKRRDISPENYGSAAQEPSPRHRELSELYARYQSRLAAANLLDAEGLFLAARDGIQRSKAIATGLELVVVDGFTDFTSAQLGILKVLAERASRTLVTLLGDAPSRGAAAIPARNDLFAKTIATRESLMQLGALCHVEVRRDVRPQVCKPDSSADLGVTSEPTSQDSPPSPALAHAARNLFRSFGDLEPLTERVRNDLGRLEILAASGVHAEIEEVARRVKGQLLAGTAPGEIVVAFRSTRDVADRVRSVFHDFGIPFHLDQPRRLSATPLVRSLLSVLRLHAEDWPYRRVLHVLADMSLSLFSEGAAVQQWGDGTVQASQAARRAAAERCVRYAQLPLGRRALLEQIATWAADETGLASVDPATASLAQPSLVGLAALLDAIPAQASLAEWLTSVEALARALGLLSTERRLAPESQSGQNQTQHRAAAAWSNLVNGLRDVSQLDERLGATTQFSEAEFIELLATTAAELSAPDERDSVGKVRVLSADAARFVHPQHMFIAGLSEQAFLAGRRGRDGSPDDEASPDAASEEMLLFYQLVSRPMQSLTLSYPALDAKAQAMPASPFLVELQRSFNNEVRVTTQPLAHESQHAASQPLSRSDLRRDAVRLAMERKRDLLAALARSPRYGEVGQSVVDGIEAVASRGDRRAFGAYDGLFSSDAVQQILEGKYGPNFLWSPSQLETYAGCRFKFFAQYVLKLAPLPEMALESDMARRGSVLHDTLARLYARLNAAAAEGGPPPTPELVAQRFQETLDAIVHGRPGRGLDGALREIERRQIASWAQKFAEQDRQYAASLKDFDEPLTPRYFEARFGPKNRRSQSQDDATLSTEKPFELTVGGQPIRFTGQIDRIDVGRVGDSLVFNVIDYKTSPHARVKPEQVEAGVQIQLPLYAMAAAELLLADKQAAALSAGYWSIRGKGFGGGARGGGLLAIGKVRDGKVELAAGWSQLRETLLARIGALVGDIRRGVFPVYSDDKNCTQFCELSTSCRIAHIRSLDKAWPPVESPSLEGRG